MVKSYSDQRPYAIMVGGCPAGKYVGTVPECATLPTNIMVFLAQLAVICEFRQTTITGVLASTGPQEVAGSSAARSPGRSKPG
jgi:hypothetical protein